MHPIDVHIVALDLVIVDQEEIDGNHIFLVEFRWNMNDTDILWFSLLMHDNTIDGQTAIYIWWEWYILGKVGDPYGSLSNPQFCKIQSQLNWQLGNKQG